MDGDSDVYLASLYGFELQGEFVDCPWHLAESHEMDTVGSYAYCCLDVRVQAMAPELRLDGERLAAYEDAQGYVRQEFAQEGDLAVKRIGARWQVASGAGGGLSCL